MYIIWPIGEKEKEQNDPLSSMIHLDSLNKLVKMFFAQFKWLGSTPICKVLPCGKIIIKIFCFSNDKTLDDSKINALGLMIANSLFKSKLNGGFNSTKFKQGIELRLIQIRYPYLDSSILAQYLAFNGGKYTFSRMQKMVFRKTPIIKMKADILSGSASSAAFDVIKAPFSPVYPDSKAASQSLIEKQIENPPLIKLLAFSQSSFKADWEGKLDKDRNKPFLLPSVLTGVKLELAGRLTTKRAVPRKTLENQHVGSFTVSKNLNSSLNLSQYVSKNKLGSYTMKVWLSDVNLK